MRHPRRVYRALSQYVRLAVSDTMIRISGGLLATSFAIFLWAVTAKPAGAFDGPVGVLAAFGIPVSTVSGLVILSLRVSDRFHRFSRQCFSVAVTDPLVITAETSFAGAIAVWVWSAFREIGGYGTRSHGLLAWEGFVVLILCGLGVGALVVRVLLWFWREPCAEFEQAF